MYGGHSVVEAYVLLADCARRAHWLQLPPAPETFAQPGVERSLRDEGDGERTRRRTSAAEKGAIDLRFCRFDRGVAVCQRAPGGHTALDYQVGLDAEELWTPQDDIGQLIPSRE